MSSQVLVTTSEGISGTLRAGPAQLPFPLVVIAVAVVGASRAHTGGIVYTTAKLAFVGSL